MTRLPLPPGECRRLTARSVLVVAPHFDDEVLGCGGLVAQLGEAGAVTRVLFLTDGGGDLAGAEREQYSRRRSEEAREACRMLGIRGVDMLDLPDGELAERLVEAGEGIRRALLSQRPDLVLVPSPLEVTADHRAAFAALHRTLAPLRGSELEEIGTPRLLLYEVNHPQYPDLLVDVGAELEKMKAAMACYSSQEEVHPYLAAALGLRRYRALSLPPSVHAAEAYREVGIDAFRTRGLASLVQSLGGTPTLHSITEGPRVSIVVRTQNRPGLLAEAMASLERSVYRNLEIVVVNDGGAPPALAPDVTLPVLRVDLPRSVGRAGAANAGLTAATGQYVGFLDDDDLAEPEHVATLVGLVRAADVRVAYTDAAVGVYEVDGRGGWAEVERRLPYSRDFDAERLLVDNYIPFNTILIERALATAAGPLDETLPFFEDWDFLIRLSRLAPFHHLPRVTCEYRHFRGATHHVFGERPRQRADFLAVKARVIEKHAALAGPAVLARVVDGLRGESVELGEALRSARAAEHRLGAELDTLRRDLVDAESRFHRLNGEREALRGDLSRLRAESERLAREGVAHQRDAGALREELGRRDLDLQRLYDAEAALRGEVVRLTSLIAAMEKTRAWRAHAWLDRRRGRPGAADR